MDDRILFGNSAVPDHQRVFITIESCIPHIQPGLNIILFYYIIFIIFAYLLTLINKCISFVRILSHLPLLIPEFDSD